MSQRTPLIALVAVMLVLGLSRVSTAQLAWSRAHATAGNEALLDVTTAPAGRGSVGIPEIGKFASGVGPVTGTDGTVFIGNTDGKVLAFRADGTAFWSRDTGSTGAILGSPAVTSDGNVFVVTSRIVRDHRTGAPPSGIRSESFVHRFNAGGGWSGPMPFPTRDGITGFTSAPFNVWRAGGVELLMVPVVYRVLSTTEIRLLAFSALGTFVGDARVALLQDEVTGGPALPGGFEHGALSEPSGYPAVAIFNNPQGGLPIIAVTDHNHTVVFFRCESDGTTAKFTELFRKADKSRLYTPTVQLDGHTRIGTADGRLLSLTGPNTPVAATAVGIGAVYAVTRTADDRLVAIGNTQMAVLRGTAVLSRTHLPGMTFVRAAASHTHVYVATTEALVTFDAATMAEVMRFPWHGGGYWPPVIGPQGHVYAMASNALFVFRPPTGTAQPRELRTPEAVTPGAAIRDHRR